MNTKSPRHALYRLVRVAALLPALTLGCAGSGGTTTGQDVPPAPTAPPPPPPPQPAAVKENASFVAGILRSMEFPDETRFIATVDVRTALPASPGVVSLTEPGQTLRVVPLYDEGPGGVIDLQLERNRRLYEIRQIPIGGPVIGRMQLREDGLWYLLDTNMDPK